MCADAFAGSWRPWMAGLSVVVAGIALAPAASAGDGDALVIVNGTPLSRQQVTDALLESYGLRMMQQMIFLELARQETARRGVQVTEAEVDEQFRGALAEIAPTADAEGVALDEQGQRQALEKFLQLRCLTMPEFMIAMRRNAHLRKAVEADFRVDEATLREEFARTYGEKVEVRHIQVDATDTLRLHEALNALARPGAEFAEVARRFSINAETAARGGLMPSFAFTDETVPAALREIAFSLAPGEVSSSVLTGKMIHILKLERRLPPADVRLDDVRGEVERKLRERVVRQRMNELLTKLYDQAQIRVLDAKLKPEFDRLRKQMSSNPPAGP